MQQHPTPQPVPAPSHWARAVYMACAVCQHGRTDTGSATRGTRREATQCVCPAVAGTRRAIPVEEARSNHGPCGPEAHHQVFPGLFG